jgi:hypothetical protein
MTGTTDDPGADDALVRGPESTLSAALADLDDGCCVLVTGDVSDDAYRVAASRYFGATLRRRRRVLALTTDGSASPSAWFPDGVDATGDDAAVVRLDGAVRDPAAAAGRSDGGAGAGAHPPEGAADSDSSAPSADGRTSLDLDAGDDGAVGDAAGIEDGSGAAAMQSALLDAIGEVTPEADADRSGRHEFRVGIFRVDMLCATLGSAATGALLRDVSRRTRDRGGMAQLHLPRPTDGNPRSDPVIAEVVDLLGDTLDVIVELRSRETASAPEERWHILEWETTEWNALR